jgi:hypothetical protein
MKMKKVVALAVLVAVFGFPAKAQKLDPSEVPAAVKAAFAKKYPRATAKWERENGKYEAAFKQKGHTMSALFDTNGTMAESEIDIKVGDLPAATLAYVKEHYKGKIIKEASRITKADGTINYEADVSGKDVIFDESGKFVKETKD